MDLTISIVSYNTKDILRKCLTSIYKYTKDITFEIIVVDNASLDGTPHMVQSEFPQVTLIANKNNKFFAKANNQALKKAKGKYFLILNSDTYFIDNSLKKMVSFMEKNISVGGCEGLEFYEDGSIVQTGSRLSTPLIDFYELSYFGTKIANKKVINSYRISSQDRKNTFEIDVGCDAFFIVRKDIMDRIGGYDEKLLLYYTENDLCLRIKKLGYKVVHLGESKIIHKVSVSVNKLGWKKMDIYYRDLLSYYIKHKYIIGGLLLFGLLKTEETALKIRAHVRQIKYK